MESVLLERVKKTRTLLRKHVLETIFNEFDEACMELDLEKRRMKYNKMMESPFRFFRGSAYLFYYDITKIPFSYHTPEDKPTWIQGDLHMENFGAFQNEHGEIVYDVNDFDEGYMGSYIYDVLRMAVSIALYGDELSISEEEQEEKILLYLSAYYEQLKRFKDGIDDPYTLTFTKKNTSGPVKKVLKKLKKRQRNHLLKDITYINEAGKRVFAWSDEIQEVSEAEWKTLEKVMVDYYNTLKVESRREHFYYKVKDIAVKHGSGTASIGLDRYYILVEGGMDANETDDLVLEIKEVRTPIPAYFLPYRNSFWEKLDHQGKRVVATQKAMHHLEDPHLGYLTIEDRHFYVRERSPYKKRVKTKHIKSMEDLNVLLDTMGKITAKIHSRADMDIKETSITYQSEDEILKAIGDEFDRFCEQIVFTAMTFKKQVNKDFELFKVTGTL